VFSKLVETDAFPEEGATNEYQILFKGFATHQQEPRGSFGSGDAKELSPIISGASTIIGIASHNKTPELSGVLAWLVLAYSVEL